MECTALQAQLHTAEASAQEAEAAHAAALAAANQEAAGLRAQLAEAQVGIQAAHATAIAHGWRCYCLLLVVISRALLIACWSLACCSSVWPYL